MTRNINSWTAAAAFGALIACCNLGTAQVLDDENKIATRLEDGTSIVLFGENTKSRDKSKNYYYLPTGLRLARRPDGTPEFLFLKFTTDDRGGASGAIVHFLMEWGLTREQESEVNRWLDREHGAKLVGPAKVSPAEDGGSFRIVSATLKDGELTGSLITSGKAPVLPGNKLAAAARLNATGAQLLAATFDRTRSITDCSIVIDLTFQTVIPAADGVIRFHWHRLETERDTLAAEYSRTKTGSTGAWFWKKDQYAYSYEEMRSHYDFMVEKNVVELQFNETYADERVDKIREAFFQYFLNSFSDAAPGDEVPIARGEDDDDKDSPDVRFGTGYSYRKSIYSRSSKRKTQEFKLNYNLAVRQPLQLTENLITWYDSVRDNPKCVSAVNLNDPFFEHRDIQFVLDLDAKAIFDDVVNYVTVNVRKNRSSGRPFEDHVTIDARYLKEHGIAAAVTYARGEDRNPDGYQWRAQWSLKGGEVYSPSGGKWTDGSWEGVTLKPPVAQRTIEVEADLDAMRSSDITRITAQVRYFKLGREIEENIHVSVARAEPLVERKIFLDQDARGFAYRLVVNHKTEGKLALPWSAQIDDDYIFAAIPEHLLADSTIKEQAKEAAKEAAPEGSVLDKFDSLRRSER